MQQCTYCLWQHLQSYGNPWGWFEKSLEAAVLAGGLVGAWIAQAQRGALGCCTVVAKLPSLWNLAS